MARSKDSARESVWGMMERQPGDRGGDGLVAAEDIAARIQDLIIREGLSEGSRLPSERDLAHLLGTSRPTVSQAIRILVVRGLIESRRGSGAYVLRRPEASLAASVDLILNLNRESVSHLAEMRFWLESTGVGIAIDRRDEHTFEEAELALEQIRQSVGDTAAWMTADTRFHAALVRASGNPYLISIYESVHIALIDYEYRGWIERNEVPEWLGEDSVDDQMEIHGPILRAVMNGDREAALVAVRRHHEVMARHLGSGGV